MPSNKLFPTDEEKQQFALQEYADSLRLPVEVPDDVNRTILFPAMQQGIKQLLRRGVASPEVIKDRLLGTNGEERQQLWPEKMVRSATTLPGDVVSGKEPIIDPATGHTSEHVIERAQDVAGMAGGTMFASPKSAVGAMGGKLIPVDHDPFAIAKPFYSAVEHAITNNNQAKMTGDQWLGTLSNAKGVKPEELQWTGLSDFLAENKGKPVSKQEVQDHLNSNKVELKEVNKVDNSKKINELENKDDFLTSQEVEELERLKTNSSTKYHDYQLPGGENYREMLLTLPEKVNQSTYNIVDKNGKVRMITSDKNEADAMMKLMPGSELKTIASYQNDAYRSSHWDEPNILAHVRMNDRNIDGKKSLHLEEIQSDWHQQGREKGYKGDNKPLTEIQIKRVKELTPQIEEMRNKGMSLDDIENTEVGKEFSNLRDIHREFERQNKLDKVPDAPFKKSWHELALKRIIREAAEKGYDRISLTPGAEHNRRYPDRPEKEQKGMEYFYDTMLPKTLEKIGKEYGVKVQRGSLKYKGDFNKKDNVEYPIHYIDVPQSLKDTVMKKGFPLFSGGVMYTPVDNDPWDKQK